MNAFRRPDLPTQRLRETLRRFTAQKPSCIWRLHALDDGKISMSALFVALAFFVTIAFVGNAEMTVFRKLEAQNAADSMALTCSTWRARGLNAITANNHLMGELSAVVVLVEALGGPELDGSEEHVDESEEINDAIKNPVFGSVGDIFSAELIQEFIPVMGSVGSASGFASVDKEYVDFLRDTFTEDEGDHDAGATIYDGQMSMKILIWYGFGTKLASNAVYFVASVISFGAAEGIAAAGNLGVHIAIDGALIPVVKDWYLTKVVIVFAQALQPLRDPALPVALEGLSLYGDSLADSVQVRSALEASLSKSQQEFGVESFQTFPLLKDFRLPVRKEGPPETGDASGDLPPSLSGLEPDEPFVVAAIKTPIRSVQDTIDTINDILPDFLGLDIDLSIMPGDAEDARELSRDEGGGFGFPGNPSLEHLEEYASDNDVNWELERSSQWIRSTYPQVDELRRPMCQFFEDIIPTSYMSTYYVHWTNRYTISATHRLRTDGEDRHLYILEDSQPDAKGNEPWTDDPPRAEELFAMQVFVKVKTPRAILMPPFFPNPNKKGVMAMAESLAYNANGRRVTGPTNLPTDRQPDTGWDTLNWVPPVAAPEWGSAQEAPPADLDEMIAVFSTGAKLRPDAASRIQLNWQSKLSPFGVARLKSALNVPEISQFFERSGQQSLLPDPTMVLH